MVKLANRAADGLEGFNRRRDVDTSATARTILHIAKRKFVSKLSHFFLKDDFKSSILRGRRAVVGASAHKR
jgi:hypothetical protein